MPFPRQSSFVIPIGAQPAEISDQAMLAELTKLYNSVNTIATQLDLYTGNSPVVVSERSLYKPADSVTNAPSLRVFAKAAVNLVIGELVTFSVVSGNLTASKAQANTTHNLKCRGIALETVLSGGWIPVQLGGSIVEMYSGLVPNADYYLSTTAGALAAGTPAATNTLQFVGYAINSTTLFFNPEIRHTVA